MKHSKIGDKELNHDIHGVALATGLKTKLLVTTPDGIWSSLDEGESWSLHGFPRFAERDTISYCRGVAIKPGDPDTIFVGNGDFIPGKRGAIQRSRDGGASWEACKLPVEPNSTIYWFGVNPANPDVVVANSLHGYLYLSIDSAIHGPSCAASSARFAPSPGCRTRPDHSAFTCTQIARRPPQIQRAERSTIS